MHHQHHLNICPVCGHYHEKLITTLDAVSDEPIVMELQEEKPGWQHADGVCTRCIDQAAIAIENRILAQPKKGDVISGYKILSLGERLSADLSLTGKGVTICMIDSGFDPHPDLLYPENRILKIVDITAAPGATHTIQPKLQKWHGTMTSVVCAGNGHMSGGKYASLAPDASVILIRVMDDEGVITSSNIIKAIQWAIRHQKAYNIRIINLSVYGDEGVGPEISPINQAVRQAHQAGMVVVAAAGNDASSPLHAPANCVEAISVGGLDDQNSLNPLMNTIYHSSYGAIADLTHKPDIIAPAVWIAAPVLPGTKEHNEAGILFSLRNAEDAVLKAILANEWMHLEFPATLLQKPAAEIRAFIEKRIEVNNYITPHYKHVEGTSFAAPILCSVIAQMIEANPALDPVTIREILMITSRSLPSVHSDRQGWGVVQPKYATQMAQGKRLSPPAGITPVIDYRKREVQFYFYHDDAMCVELTGDFLQWDSKSIALTQDQDNGNEWRTAVPFGGRGVFQYKFIVDQKQWLADPRNPYRQPDGYNGFNSKLIIQ
jgi:serine protease AprX